jgi:hypothetical protein
MGGDFVRAMQQLVPPPPVNNNFCLTRGYLRTKESLKIDQMGGRLILGHTAQIQSYATDGLTLFNKSSEPASAFRQHMLTIAAPPFPSPFSRFSVWLACLEPVMHFGGVVFST